MVKGILLTTVLAITFATALFMRVGESDAAFHLMRIDGAMAGFNGDTTIQYVELRSANEFQNVLGSHVLCFFDTAGAPYAMFRFPSNSANDDDGASYLVGTSEFDTAWAAGAPDYSFSPATTTAIAGGADVDHPMRAPGGKVAFGSDATMTASMMCQAGFSVIDSVAYGTGYTGTVNFGTKLASDLPTSSTMALHIVGPVCIEFSAHPCPPPAARDNSINYSIVDANAGANQPRNSVYLTGPISAPDTDADGVPDASDLCPGSAPAAIVDANGCSQAQVDADADGICDPAAPSAGPAPGCTGSDNCPNWANPTQTLPPWTVPSGDPDCDGFTSAREAFVTTLPLVTCSPTATPNHTPDEWPADFNNDQASTLTDIFNITPHLNTFDTDPGSSTRFDLTGDGAINLSDIFLIIPFLNKSCV